MQTVSLRLKCIDLFSNSFMHIIVLLKAAACIYGMLLAQEEVAMVHSICGLQVKLCDLLTTRAIPESFYDKIPS